MIREIITDGNEQEHVLVLEKTGKNKVKVYLEDDPENAKVFDIEQKDNEGYNLAWEIDNGVLATCKKFPFDDSDIIQHIEDIVGQL